MFTRRMLIKISDQLDRLERKIDMADVTLDDVLADTTAETTADASIVTLLTGLQTQLTQALSGQTISPAAQAKVDAIFKNMQANDAAISAAILANTPVNPTPPAGGGTAPTTVSVTSSQNPSQPGAPVTLTAAVSGDGKNPITGSVQFQNNGAALQTANVDSTGVAAISVTTLGAGQNSITAVYSGDGNNAGSTSGTLAQTVSAANTASGPAKSAPALAPVPLGAII